jgi:hypothetical protein
MITLDMCLDYIENPYNKRSPYMFKEIRYPVILSEAQKKFLGNLCEGKITDTPRCFGKTFLIKLYCECLDYYTDMAKYDSSLKDDYISLEEVVNSWKPYGINPYSQKMLLEAYEINKEKALRDYNMPAEYINKLKQEEVQQND